MKGIFRAPSSEISRKFRSCDEDPTTNHLEEAWENKLQIVNRSFWKPSAAGSCLHRLRRESTSGTHDTIE
ncbi:hypothetical protein AVEN_99067-1 [Araneus ventricosus]|uniref:Uncharacterized protein n=1 Tax=Araneus ventricosus TaxID=182803 RepID=A0A4Y2FLN8_ARAVE|nr:hypothetical protein AVEN_99067-1 [Araneus ventricosus]